MAYNAILNLGISVLDGNSRQVGPPPIHAGFSPTVQQEQAISLAASATTSVVVPTGAKVLVLDLGIAFHLVLKGISGDIGIPLAGTARGLGIPLVLPLGDSPTIAIQNLEASIQVVRATWL